MSQITQESALLFTFTDQSESYTLGFEAGQIYEEMKTGTRLYQRLIHTANTQQVRLMGIAMNYHGWFEDAGTEGWSYAFLKPRDNPQEGE